MAPVLFHDVPGGCRSDSEGFKGLVLGGLKGPRGIQKSCRGFQKQSRVLREVLGSFQRASETFMGPKCVPGVF